jgi:hypothetical protein
VLEKKLKEVEAARLLGYCQVFCVNLVNQCNL